MTIKDEVLRELTMDEFSNTSLKVLDLTLKKVEELIDEAHRQFYPNNSTHLKEYIKFLKQKLRGGE